MIRLQLFREQHLYSYHMNYDTDEECKHKFPYWSKAVTLWQQNKCSKAINLMKSLVTANPKNDIYHHLYANALSWNDDHDLFGKQIDLQRKIAYQLNPTSLYNILLYAQTLTSKKTGADKSRRLIKKALKKSKFINREMICMQLIPAEIKNVSSNSIHLSLAWNYASVHPYNFRKSFKHILKSMGTGDKLLVNPMVLLKTLLHIGKYQSGLNIYKSVDVEKSQDENKNFIFEFKKVRGHFLLNMERYDDAIKIFLAAQSCAITKEQLLECCTAFVLCYSHLSDFENADKWLDIGQKIWKRDQNREILPEVAIDLFNAYSFLWYKKKLHQNRKRNRQFSKKLQHVPRIALDEPRFKHLTRTAEYNAPYFFVYGLHAQYNDNLLIEAIIAYHLGLKEFPAAIIYWHSSIAFFDLKYYGMSLKLLKRAYKISSEIPTIQYGYNFKELSLINIIYKDYCCGNCKSGNKKLRACMGCCKAYYCSKQCQKMHWKLVHRNICDGKFGLIMKVIRNQYIDASDWKRFRKQLVKAFPKYISNVIQFLHVSGDVHLRDRHV
eukprot:279573_1